MSKQLNDNGPKRSGWLGSCLLSSFWLGILGLTTSCFFVLCTLVVFSIGLNAYLGWATSGVEVVINVPASPPLATATIAVAALPSNTAVPNTATSTVTPLPSATQTPTNLPTASSTATSSPTVLPTATSIPAVSAPDTAAVRVSNDDFAYDETNLENILRPLYSTSPLQETDDTTLASLFIPPENSYTLIPIEGVRDARPGLLHGDFNLALREPQPSEAEPILINQGRVRFDTDGPNLSAIFEPNFTKTYTIHHWDWQCNCKGQLLQNESLNLVGIATTPGEAIYIPPRETSLFEDKYYAVVLYASADSLTFQYRRSGVISNGYTVHYLGLQTDPVLIDLYQQTVSNMLPGLTLDTPVGVATDELIVAIRENGTFLDVRSQEDWWQ